MGQIGQQLAPGGVHCGEPGDHIVERGRQRVKLRTQLCGGDVHVVVAAGHLPGGVAERGQGAADGAVEVEAEHPGDEEGR